MTIPFTCPHCGTQTDVYEEYAGKKGPCAICGKTIIVPYALTTEPAGARATGSETAPAVPARGRPVVVIAAVVVGGLLTAAILVSLLMVLVFPAVSAARVEGHKRKSAAHMKRIVVAMQNYEADYGCFPPAYVADDDGKPMHSWRVLLLPYLGYEHVHRLYNFDQPWDAPENMEVRFLMPDEYACPADPDAAQQYETSYMVLVGPRTVFPGSESVRRSAITDGVENTLMLVQTPACGVCWTEPRDLDVDHMQFEVNGQEGIELGSCHPHGAHVVTGDAQVHFLADETPPDYVEAMSTIDGDEIVPWNMMDQ
jgi:hypothetical protein